MQFARCGLRMATFFEQLTGSVCIVIDLSSVVVRLLVVFEVEASFIEHSFQQHGARQRENCLVATSAVVND